MKSIGERIKEMRDIRGLTQQQLADKLGESSGRVIYNWEKGIARPDSDKISRLCIALQISADELLGCKIETPKPTTSEWDAILKYRQLDAFGQAAVDSVLKIEFSRVSQPKKKARLLRLDFYNYPASAGTGNFLETETPEDIFVKECSEAEDADYVIPISGDSMEPTYHSGDKVFVEKCDSLAEGEIGIFIVNGDAYIKELGSKCLISHNSTYKPIKLGSSDSVYCCGRVLGVVEE